MSTHSQPHDSPNRSRAATVSDDDAPPPLQPPAPGPADGKREQAVEMEITAAQVPSIAAPEAPALTQVYPKHWKYVMAALLTMVNTFCYADRTNMSVAVLQFGYNKDLMGNVLGAFFYGYLLTQLPTGIILDRFGAKKILIIGICVWTVADFSTIWLSSLPTVLIAMRILMGLGEGVNYPCVHDLASAWFPVEEKSSLMTLVTSGQDLGSIISLTFAPVISDEIGWQYIFIIFGVCNLLWILAFAIFGADSPTTNRKYNGHESIKNVPWKEIISNRACMCIFVTQFCFNYAWFVLLGWIPTFYIQKLNFDLKSHSALAALPYIFGWFGLNFAGYSSDWMIKNKFSVTFTRRLMNSIGFFGFAIGLIVVGTVSEQTAAVIVLCIMMFIARMALAGYWVNMLDVAPQYAGQLMSVSNTIATIPGIIGNILTGAILETTGNWTLVFLVAAILTLIGGITFLLLSSGEEQFGPTEATLGKALVTQVPTEPSVSQPSESKLASTAEGDELSPLPEIPRRKKPPLVKRHSSVDALSQLA